MAEGNAKMDIAAAVLAEMESLGFAESGSESPKLTDYIDEDWDEFIALPLLKQWNIEWPPQAEITSYGEQNNLGEKLTVADVVAFPEWCVEYNEKHPTYRDEVRAYNASWRVRIPRIFKKVLWGIFFAVMFGGLILVGLFNMPVTCISILVFLALSAVGLYFYGRKQK